MSVVSRARQAALAAGAVALIAPSVQAQAFLGSGNISGCGGSTFTSCAIWNAALSNSNKTLTLSVTNTTGANTGNTNSVFTQIILGNLNSYTLANNGFSATGAGTWSGGGGGFQQCTPSNLCGFNGFGLNASALGANSHGNQGIGSGQTTIFTMTFTTALVPSDFNDVQLAFHDQGPPGNCLTNKVVFDGNTGVATSQTANPTCGPGVATVPEPASTGLLLTGLSGLGGIGGIGRLRRRFAKQS